MTIAIIYAGMYKGICEYNSSKFWDKTSNMTKFTKLMEASFNDR